MQRRRSSTRPKSDEIKSIPKEHSLSFFKYKKENRLQLIAFRRFKRAQVRI